VVERYVSVRVTVRSRELGERVAAEAFEAGASGLEERAEGLELLIYASDQCARAVTQALESLASGSIVVGPREEVADVDWSRAWREGLEPIEISPRLLIRPSFAQPVVRAGQGVLEIDTGQAFGTGGHASTRLALTLLDALPDSLLRGARVLDVGCGSGVLALAALRLGAACAVALDTDPLATEATRSNARANGLSAGIRVFTGSPHALRTRPFDVVLANLLRSELEPLLPAIAGAIRPGGRGVVSGLLADERDLAARAFGALDLAIQEGRTAWDGGDEWLACLIGHQEPDPTAGSGFNKAPIGFVPASIPGGRRGSGRAPAVASRLWLP